MDEMPLKQLPRPRKIAEFEDKYGLIGDTQPMFQVMETIEQVAPTNISVLIVGESGTGKEVVARAIFGKSLRKEKAFVIVNCAAIPEGLLESELFGHEKGAFTGAIGSRKGYFEMADGGTIFLDEIGEMPPNTQTKLLRVLEGGQFMRVGGSDTKVVDVRVITATNRNLERAVQRGEFRHDLFFRLNAVKIQLPALRERKKDIRKLALKFADDFCHENHIDFKGFSDSALEMMEDYSWPGNVRELKNKIESIIVLEKGAYINDRILQQYIPLTNPMDRNMPIPLNKSPEQVERELIYSVLIDLKNEVAQLRQIILERLFPSQQIPGRAASFVSPYHFAVDEEIISTDENGPKTMQQMERQMIYDALKRAGGNKRKAAKELKISERTLYRKIKEYDIPF